MGIRSSGAAPARVVLAGVALVTAMFAVGLARAGTLDPRLARLAASPSSAPVRVWVTFPDKGVTGMRSVRRSRGRRSLSARAPARAASGPM